MVKLWFLLNGEDLFLTERRDLYSKFNAPRPFTAWKTLQSSLPYFYHPETWYDQYYAIGPQRQDGPYLQASHNMMKVLCMLLPVAGRVT